MPRNASYSTVDAKAKVLELISQGLTVRDAMEQVGRALKTAENWRATDKVWAGKVDEARERRKRAISQGKDEDAANLGFEEWRSRFLHRATYDHHRQWIDVLEGREPQELHPSIAYEPGRPNRLLINTPPFHAKSTVITQEYAAYRICMNPNIRILLVSQTQQKAKEFLYSIKQMLTSPFFLELQTAYAPEGGFKPARADGSVWSQDKIYVAGRGGEDAADPAAKDPTIQALGIRGHIYGSRADLIILDDCVTLANANEYEKQIKWLNQEVSSRAKNGKIIIVGTRVAPVDLYSHLRDGDNFPSGRSPWTYLGQPAVLDYAEKPEDWTTLWPKSKQPLDENEDDAADEDGLFRAWDGPALSDVREQNLPRDWALVYMQQSVGEVTTFHPTAVNGSVDGRRKAGPLVPGAWGHPRAGMEGLHVIGSIDPAGTGLAFILLYAVNRVTKERWVLNCWTRSNTIPSWYAEQIEQLTAQYGVNEWVIESNAYASWLIHDERITAYLRNNGVKLVPHYTSRNKADPDFGVASMSSLFGSLTRIHEGAGREVHEGNNLIHLPDPKSSEGVKALIEQLVSWQPGKQGRQLRQDGPMALWFAELVARPYVGYASADTPRQHHMKNSYAARRDVRARAVIPSDTYRLWQQDAQDAAGYQAG